MQKIIAASLFLSINLFASSERSDIKPLLSALQCSANKIGFTQLLELQRELKIFDQQIHAKKITAPSHLELKAKALATKHHFQGFSYGQCPDGRSWIAAVPAPRGIEMSGKEVILPKESLSQFCKKYELRFAAAEGGVSKLLEKVDINLLPAGTLSVTCTPKEPSWLGPQLWYLFATGPINESARGGNELLPWVNEIRAREGLLALQEDSFLSSLAKQANTGSGVAHNRKQLQEIQNILKGQLIGEDKVIGSTLSEIIQLLWHSPKHRDLLLQPEAKTLGIARDERSGFVQYTLLISRGSRRQLH